MAELITSRTNQKVKDAVLLAGSPAFREEKNLFFAEGKTLCYDLAQSLRVDTFFVSEEFYEAHPEVETMARQCFLVAPHVVEKLAETKSPQGIFGLFEPAPSTLETLRPEKGVLVCEGLQDPANTGAILRSAAAFGFGGVVLTQGCADPYSPKALRGSMGAVGRIALVHNVTVEQACAHLHSKGSTIYAAAIGQQAVALQNASKGSGFALLIGSEGAGLSQQALALADERVYIPMQNGVQSLNAAVAASVLMFHFSGLSAS